MSRLELDKLLEKYYKGLTSESEEDALFELLSDKDLHPDYENDISILKGLKSNEYISDPDDGFESRIMNAIDDSEGEKKIKSLKRQIYSAVSVAASLLIIISSYLLLRNSGEPKDTFDDPVLAYNATVEVLERVGRTLNTGSDVISELSIISKTEQELHMLSEPARVISREMESLKYIEQSIDILDLRQAENK